MFIQFLTTIPLNYNGTFDQAADHDNMRRLDLRWLKSATVAVGLMTFNDVGPTLVLRIKKTRTSP